MRQLAAQLIWLVLLVQFTHAQDAESDSQQSFGLVGIPELLEHDLYVPATLDRSVFLYDELSNPPASGFARPLRISIEAMIGRRVFDPSHIDEYESNAGMLLSVESDFQSRWMGFDGWESNARWLQSDTLGFAETSGTIEVYDGAGTGDQVSTDLFRRSIRFDTIGDQSFVSTDLNLYRDLWWGNEARWRFSFLNGIRYLYSGEDYDTTFTSNALPQPQTSPYLGYELTNHMVGGQIGLRGVWSMNRLRMNSRLVGGLMHNRLSTESRALALATTSLSPNETVWVVQSHKESRLSSLIEAETMLNYRLGESIDVGIGCYAVHLSNQKPQADRGSHDLALLGLKLGLGYLW